MTDVAAVDFLPRWLRSTPAALVDLETTGVDPATARIVQIAVVPVDDGVPHDPWSELLYPGGPIPEHAAKIHGITDQRVEDAPLFRHAATRIRRRLEGRLLVGYNLRHYDVPLLRAEYDRIGDPLAQPELLDVLVLVRHFDRFVRGKGRHQLGATSKRHGFEVRDAHDAVGDCRMTWGVLLSVCRTNREHAAFRDRADYLRWQERTAKQQEADFERWQKQHPPKAEAGGP